MNLPVPVQPAAIVGHVQTGPVALARYDQALGKLFAGSAKAPAAKDPVSTQLWNLVKDLSKDSWVKKLPVIGRLLRSLGDRSDREFHRQLLMKTFQAVITRQCAVEDLTDLGIVGRVAEAEVSYDLAAKILDRVEALANHPDVQNYFRQTGDDLAYEYCRRRFVRARRNRREREEEEISALNAAAYAFEQGLRFLSGRPRPDHWHALLTGVVKIGASLLDDKTQAVDANVMFLEDPDWDALQRHVEAASIFTQTWLDDADAALVVRHSTASAYNGFWVPQFHEVSRTLPGAPSAFNTGTLCRLFTKRAIPFKPGVPQNLQNRIDEYFKSAPFDLLLSMPLAIGPQMLGVVNINIEKEEARYFDEAECQRFAAMVRALLGIMAALRYRELSQAALPPSDF